MKPRANLPFVWSSVRPASLLVTLVGVVVGIASAGACGCVVDRSKAVLTIVLAMAAHAGLNLLGAGRIGADHLAPSQAPDAAARRLGRGLLFFVMPAGAILAVHSGGGLLVVGAVGLLIGSTSASKPTWLKQPSLDAIAAAAAWWLVVVGANYVQRGQFSIVPSVTALAYGAMVGAVRLAEGGVRGRARIYAATVLAAHAGLAVSAWALISPTWTLLALAALPFAAWATWALLRDARASAGTVGAPQAALAATLVHGIGLAAGFHLVAAMR